MASSGLRFEDWLDYCLVCVAQRHHRPHDDDRPPVAVDLEAEVAVFECARGHRWIWHGGTGGYEVYLLKPSERLPAIAKRAALVATPVPTP